MLHHLAINDTVLILDAEESVEPVYERLACAIVDAGCITSRHMATVLRRRFGGDPTWPAVFDATSMEPSHIAAAFAQTETAKEAIDLLGELAAQSVVETNKAQKAKEPKEEKPKAEKVKNGVEILHPTSPKLDDLAGYGKAADWCRDLIFDLNSYRAGDLGWSGVDKGGLVVGPPGTGKPLLAQALAASSGLPLIATSFAQWTSNGRGYQGDTIKAMRQVFEAAAGIAPVILFIDEIVAIPARGTSDRHDDYWRPIFTGLLELMDGTSRTEGVVVIAACNHADGLDPALVRSGRVDRRFDIGMPDEAALSTIIRYHVPEASPDDIAPIATALAGTVSGADIARIAREAKRSARRQKREVTGAEILAAALPAETRPRDVLWRTAVHEAGHAVGYLVAGQIPCALSLVQTGDIQGYVQPTIAPASQHGSAIWKAVSCQY